MGYGARGCAWVVEGLSLGGVRVNVDVGARMCRNEGIEGLVPVRVNSSHGFGD